jgi:hypothetical protein
VPIGLHKAGCNETRQAAGKVYCVRRPKATTLKSNLVAVMFVRVHWLPAASFVCFIVRHAICSSTTRISDSLLSWDERARKIGNSVGSFLFVEITFYVPIQDQMQSILSRDVCRFLLALTSIVYSVMVHNHGEVVATVPVALLGQVITNTLE